MTDRNETAQPAPLGQVERMVRPAVPKRGLVERLRDDNAGAGDLGDLAYEAADELVRLHGQMETLGRWIVEALKVLDTIDPDDMDTIDPDDMDESERLMTLIKGGEMLSMSALAPQMWARARKNAGKGPACNLLRPWEQAE